MLAGSFLLSVILTAIVRKLAELIGFVAHPTEDRYHRSVIPLGGGISIFVTLMLFCTGAILLSSAEPHLNSPMAKGDSIAEYAQGFTGKLAQLWGIMAAATTLFILGLWDDLKKLGPFSKLGIQFVVALIAAGFADIRVEFFIENKIITSALSAVWIVLIINAFNFLDNMDGASAGIAVIVASILLTAAVVSGQVFVGGLAIIFIGTLLGFLVFNFPPAKIFAGDAGSLVIGFFLALLSLRTTYYHQAQSGRWYPVFIPFIVMAVPLYDFISVTALRIKQGKSPFVGDTQHFSHRLKKRGLTETQTVLTLYLATLCTGLGATFLYQVNLAGAFLIFAQTFMILAIIAILETTSGNEKNAV